MFGSKRVSLYITKDKVWASGPKASGEPRKIEWDGKSLLSAFTELSKHFGKKIKYYAILGHDLAFSEVLTFEEKITEKNIKEKVSPKLPNSTRSEEYYFEIMESSDKRSEVYVWTVEKEQAKNISVAAEKTGLEINILPSSLVLANSASKKEGALVVWSGLERLALVTKESVPYITEKLGKKTAKAVKDLLTKAKKEFGIEPKTAYMSWKDDKDEKPDIDIKDVEEKEIEPLEEIQNAKKSLLQKAMPIAEDGDTTDKKDEKKGKEKKKEKEDKKEEEDEKKEPSKSTLSKPMFAVIFFIAGLISLIISGLFFFNQRTASLQKETPEPTTTVQPVPTTSATPEPTQAPIALSDYSVEVLNGSGVSGEASRVENMLLEAGFGETEAGNADSYDYEDTIVYLKEETPQDVYSEVREALSGEYNVTLADEPLNDDSSFDLRVIVGARSE